MAMTRLNGSHFRNGEEQFIDTSGWESIHHDVDAGGNCRVPWCEYTLDNPDAEHINLDRAFTEPGRFNLFKQNERLIRENQEMRRILLNEFKTEVEYSADAHLRNTHDLTLMVMRLLKGQADGRNEKAGVLSREHRKAMNELGTIVKFIHDTFPLRANAIDPNGEMETANLAIAVMGQLRRDLLHATADREAWVTSTNEPSFIPDDEKTSSSCKHEGDTYQPHARRERTLNELHTLLHNMLFSGIDVAVRDLQDYLQRHVTAVDALVRRSVDLEQSDDTGQCYHCIEYGRDRCTKHSS